MREIIINSEKYGIHKVLVDDEDYEELSKHIWSIKKGANTFYATRFAYPYGNGKSQTILLHRSVLCILGDNRYVVDHKDCNGLNNQKDNLRLCTRAENSRNRIQDNKQTTSSTSKYKGVHWCNQKGKWRVKVMFEGREIHAGFFTEELKAANAYNVKAIELFGEFARINIL